MSEVELTQSQVGVFDCLGTQLRQFFEGELGTGGLTLPDDVNRDLVSSLDGLAGLAVSHCFWAFR